MALNSLSAARQNLQSSSRKEKEDSSRRSLEKRRSLDESLSSLSSSSSTSHRREHSSSKSSSLSKKSHVIKGETIAPPPPPANPKPIRQNIIKGLEEALRSRMEKSDDVAAMDDDRLKSLTRDIEDQMYHLYSKDVGHKYKAKYRSLKFNITDEKNNGLFRKILNGKISPKSLVNMSAEEMASKELQQWRQAELKHDIDMIKSYELDQLARGTKFVVKSHKGEEIVEESKSKKKEDVKLPDELAETEEAKTEEENFDSWGSKTWEVSFSHTFLLSTVK